MTTKPHKREGIYFGLRIAFSVLGLYFISLGLGGLLSIGETSLVATLVTFLTYLVLLLAYFGLAQVLLIGHLRGNGVEVTPQQFPEVFAMVQESSQKLGLAAAPKVFLIQSGGVLNAFATRFAGKNYVALYSDVFALVESKPEVLRFILSHELAHVQRRHVQKRFWTLLSIWVPFLGSAYSRACEYTCDSFAAELAPAGARDGLLLLAAGKDLFARVNLEHYLAAFKTNNKGAVRFAGILASHPHLPHRLQYLAGLGVLQV